MQILGVDGKINFGPHVLSLDTTTHGLPDSDRDAVGKAIQDFLPNVDPSLLHLASSTVRPSLSDGGDCIIRHNEDRKGLVELAGFDDPLTASLAVGEAVADKVKREIWHGGRAVDELARGWE